MPVYNGSRYLGQAVDSVLNQTFSDFEFIIIDDASTDKSAEIIDEYAKKDQRVRVIKNERNLGIAKSLNKGLRESHGEYIARIDDDDIWSDKEKLRKQAGYLGQNPDCALVGTAMICVDADSQEIGRVQFATQDQKIREKILLANQFSHPSVLIRKKYLDESGFYSEEKKYQHIEDYELWLRLGKKYKLANLPDYCLKYRINPQGISLKNQFRQRLAGLKLSTEYSKYYPRGFRTILIKLFSLPLSRSALDSITKNSLAKKGYAKFTGIKK